MKEHEDAQPGSRRPAYSPLLVYALSLVVVVATILGGWYWGSRVGSTRQQEVPVKPSAAKTEAVVLSFPFHDRLETEVRDVPEASDNVSRGANIAGALLAGPVGDFERIMAEGTELRSFFIDADGVAYVDMDRKALHIPRDALAAYLSIQAFYQSLRTNIPEVSAIKFLIDTREVDSLWGHFDATIPWKLAYEEP